MAFGVKRHEVDEWKEAVSRGEIAFLTHFWLDDRFPGCRTVTKAGCADLEKLKAWGGQYGLQPEWIDHKERYPHFDLFGEREYEILRKEGREDLISRFGLTGIQKA
ncbi:hypothetical protein [Bhargavaea beijingensis]|uniref:YneQ n=1 Tax=Bhargavaea beijingensis TaxID=426756 RepID=A0ABX9ZC25_9BACL|nr:hypothetical protein [Bhargavaea beijingensis]MCW1929188.1 hypothetical protein [Bhargavaea beijingensis]RSK30920.1 hypothetical protein EJA12_09370 [Bhargavaea beijingensis]